jgi:2-phospho-L-lactate transferase/gluconeogenesis factor (CofD/UPF0052 family)
MTIEPTRATGDASRPRTGDARVRVVLFSGGRGSGALSQQLIRHPAVDLTIAINGYDDGASTGEVRRFLGDALGPSDFRKNAARLAGELHSCPADVLALLDRRLPVGTTDADEVVATVRSLAAHPAAPPDVARAPSGAPKQSGGGPANGDSEQNGATLRAAIVERFEHFERERRSSGRAFTFSDCSIGNLIFAGCYLRAGRDFNLAVADYCALLGLPDGLVQNVSDGANAFLVAVDRQGRLLGSEEEIVDATRRNEIDEIFLIDRPVAAEDRAAWARQEVGELRRRLAERSVDIRLNPALIDRIAGADVIIYAPGTQHSSLFPSYMTRGLSAAIASNLQAIKLLVTNIQEDAEIAGSSAVDLVDRALHYLKEKGRLGLPAPSLITHFLLNDPALAAAGAPYVPLGPLDRLKDPRLVRIANYEDGVTGRHDAARVLAPFIDSFLTRRDRPRVAVLLHHDDSLDKLSQTILEIVRGGIDAIPVTLTIFYSHASTLDAQFVQTLPFAVRNLAAPAGELGPALRAALSDTDFQYVVLFESSGMYRGEDVVSLASHLRFVSLDAVWGSRRLSARAIAEAYRLRYQHNAMLGAISYVGSHLLSAMYLLLYGRYISDTLSAALAVRTPYLLEPGVDPMMKGANHALLSALLRDRAEILETPVQFFPLSPSRARRTTVVDGLRALATILAGRFKPRPGRHGRAEAGWSQAIRRDTDARARHAGP